jgi:long-chain acyl-CoA synthetase
MENPTRIFDFIAYQQKHYPQEVAYIYRHEGKDILRYSTAQVVDLANKISRGLLRLGLRPGDKVGTVIVKNRPEWVALDLGMAQIGVINVPVYPTIASTDYEYIFNEAEIKLCFVGDDKAGSVYKKVQTAQFTVPSLTEIYTFDQVHYAPLWSDLWKNEPVNARDEATEGEQSEVERIKATIRPDDLATIIYTSGTTGQPKGVMLSQDNIVQNIMTVQHLMPMKAGDRALSFLPLNHIFERVSSYAYMLIGAQVIFTGVDNLGGDEGDLKAVQPHFFTCVPRLLEKVYEKIYNKGLELTGAKRAIFFWALALTNDYEYDKKYTGWKKFKMGIADKLIFSKWRAALGGSVQGIIVAASPCPVKIARTFSAAGVPVREGYGMTETSPGISISTFETNGAKLGYVGPILDGVEVLIDPTDGNYKENEGEILCTGRNVMIGYYNKPEETEAVVKIKDGKRWMYTGDIGRLDNINGVPMLKITDRKKELFKTSGGKYVAPAPIENKLRENFLVEQIMVVGDNQKFVSALIVPAPEALKDWCKDHNVSWTTLQEVLDNQSVLKMYKELVNHYNPAFAKVEQIKEFRLVSDNWEPVKPDGSPGELTPTMKLKRRVILEKYEDVIRGIYG